MVTLSSNHVIILCDLPCQLTHKESQKECYKSLWHVPTPYLFAHHAMPSYPGLCCIQTCTPASQHPLPQLLHIMYQAFCTQAILVLVTVVTQEQPVSVIPFYCKVEDS